MTSNEIRASFLRFFEQNGHRLVPSSSLVPHDDPTLLFTNAGMNQFKDVFLGKEPREYTRAASSQKCMRVSGKHNDLENVGPSLRHHTFFEMLGNFSFGDYFKKDAIAFAWELLTVVWKISPEQLHATVFSGEAGVPRDKEAGDRWLEFLPADRITELGLADNFWQMGETGPCGRCSEVHYFRGNHLPCPEPVCLGVACSCDRYVEIWNNVFMEFDRQPDGQLKRLPAPSIDTGMGLERTCAVLHGVISNYGTDLFIPLLDRIGEIAGTVYGTIGLPPMNIGDERFTPEQRSRRNDVSMRVIADHIRATTFLIADGVSPSNEWRGYVLRKIMRRAMRHGKRLDQRMPPFLHELADVVIKEMGDTYPELRTERDRIKKTILDEERRFDAVLSAGLPLLEAEIAKALEEPQHVLSGEAAFRLYDTFGVPLDFIEDTATTHNVTVDQLGFDRAMEAQREKARAKSAFEGLRRALDFLFVSEESQRGFNAADDRFEGYTTTTVKGTPVVALFDKDRRQVRELKEGAQGYVTLGSTPFYLESGGQVSDVGELRSEASDAAATVEGVTRLAAGSPRLHRVRLTHGTLHDGDLITAEVDATTRDATRRNHTATHLLHASLRKVLGMHVKQAGSLVAPDRLRFDFIHSSQVTREQIVEIERIVNEQVYRNSPVVTEERSTQEAIASGAMALFGEKYGDRVRVVSIPGFSMELCGGTHCRATGDIGFFTIGSEGGVAAGVRRIEALTGAGAVAAHQAMRSTLSLILEVLNVADDRAVETIEKLQNHLKVVERALEKQRVKAALDGLRAASPSEDWDSGIVTVRGTKLVRRKVPELDRSALRSLADSIRQEISSGVVILVTQTESGVQIVTAVTPDLTSRISAGRLIKDLAPIVGGKGGGRADFAEAGGKDVHKIDELLAESPRIVEGLLDPNLQTDEGL